MGEGLSMLFPHQPILRYLLPSSSLHRLAGLPLGLFIPQSFQDLVVIRSVHRLPRIQLTCPTQVHFRLLTCSVTSVIFVFSLTQIFVFLSFFLSLFVQLLACSLIAWWVPMFPRRRFLLGVCMSYRRVFSSMSRCYPSRCLGAWRMLSIRPWFFFIVSPCLGFCVLCCISVPGRCSFQYSRSGCCWHILVCRFPSSPLSSTCLSSSDHDFHFHQLIPIPCVVVHVVY